MEERELQKRRRSRVGRRGDARDAAVPAGEHRISSIRRRPPSADRGANSNLIGQRRFAKTPHAPLNPVPPPPFACSAVASCKKKRLPIPFFIRPCFFIRNGCAKYEPVNCQNFADNRHYGVAETGSLIREAIVLDRSHVDAGPGV
jgi:hypothetical protein